MTLTELQMPTAKKNYSDRGDKGDSRKYVYLYDPIIFNQKS